MQGTHTLDANAPERWSNAPERLSEGLHRLRTTVGWMPLPDTAWIAVTGEDRVRWLNGMVTNSVQALQPGEGAYAFLLSAQGRIQGDCTVWAEPDRLLLETNRAQLEPMIALLDKFIIMDDVELAALQRTGFALAGPAADAVLEGLGLSVPTEDLKQLSGQMGGAAVTVVRGYSPVVPRYELWVQDEAAANALQALFATEAETAAGSFELLRVMEERPLYGIDIRDRDLPQETAQARALHFNKGCYLGQEIVERIRSRGQVHRTFAAFRLQGESPEAGAELTAEDKPVGLLTTVAAELVDGERLALGFVRREALERGLVLHYGGGTAEARGRSAASKSVPGNE